MQRNGDRLRLNLGCGLQTPTGWINMDGSWNARLAKHPWLRRTAAALGLIPWDKAEIPWSREIIVHDVRKPLPFGDGTVEAIYTSHVLEHLYRDEGQRLIEESFRVLAPGGVLRVIVPDLRAIVAEYNGERPFGELSPDQESVPAADRLNERLLMRWPLPIRHPLFYRIYDAWQDFHSHKWMYDADSLGTLIRSAGFEQVQRKEFQQSLIDDVGSVEEPSRLLNGAGICIEGQKPTSG